VRRALVTFAAGDEFEGLLDLSLPGLEEYADLHGYDILTAPPRLLTRPPSWGKITRLLSALERYDEALWVDCDVVCLDPAVDVADELGDAWQAISRHRTREGEIPSCGLWYVRQSMQPVLEAIWRLDRYTDHPWWEQAALHQLLGYGGRPVERQRETALFAHTCWLDPEWHAISLEYPGGLVYPDGDTPERPRFVHAAPGSPPAVRARMMRDLLERQPVTHG